MSRILALLLAALLVPICVWGASGESISLHLACPRQPRGFVKFQGSIQCAEISC